MILTTTIISVAFIATTLYLSLKLKATNNKLQDYVAKYKSVKVYAESIAKQTVAAAPTPTRRVTNKKTMTTVTTTPAKRGRKPNTK